MENANVVKDISLFLLAAAVGVLPWFLDKMGIEMPKWTYAAGLIACFLIIAWALIKIGWIEKLPWVEGTHIRLSTAMIGAATLIGILWVIFAWTRKSDVKVFGNEKTETITHREYFNETVELDNKIFDHCHFTNVQLIYHGLGTVTFIEPMWTGNNYLRTDNNAAKVFGQLQYYFSNNPKMKMFLFGTMDSQGHITDIKPVSPNN